MLIVLLLVRYKFLQHTKKLNWDFFWTR